MVPARHGSAMAEIAEAAETFGHFTFDEVQDVLAHVTQRTVFSAESTAHEGRESKGIDHVAGIC